MSKNLISLQVTEPDGRVAEFQSSLESIIIGSGAEAAVRLADPKVSQLHCMLRSGDDGRVTVVDLGSATGTRLVGRAVQAPQAVAPGDWLSVGASKIRVTWGRAVFASACAEGSAGGSGAAASRERSTSGASEPQGEVLFPPPAGGRGPFAARLLEGGREGAEVRAGDELALQVALLWGDGPVQVERFASSASITVGSGAECDFCVHARGLGERFLLSRRQGPARVVAIPPEAEVRLATADGLHETRASLRAAGRLRSAPDGSDAELIELALAERLQVLLGPVSLVLRHVRPEPRISFNTFQDADFRFSKIVAIFFLVFLALVAVALIDPIGDVGLADDVFSVPARYVKMVVQPEKPQTLKKLKELSGVEEGAKAKEKEGKFGKADAKKDQADPSKKGAPVVDPNKREEDRKKVSMLMAGMFGGGSASNVFGPGGLGIGINNALGGISGGAGLGDAQGLGGLGARGSGAGGGGTGLGLGGLGTKGGGRGAGGYGSIDLGGRGKDTTRVIPGKTIVTGGLDKDVIMKVIRRHQNEIKFCYEQELQKDPKLAGKVAVAWTIDPSGAVSDANVAESTMSSANVEACILQRIRRWRFPEPEGGGVVAVTFPWIFKPAGDDGAE